MKTALSVVALAACFVVAALSLYTPKVAEAVGFGSDRWVVTLYSAAGVAEQWEALSPGEVQGESLLFPIEAGVRERSVRISGTYSVVPKN